MRSLPFVLVAALTASSLHAQAYNYPAFQTPRIVDREYNFAAATSGDAGTSLLFQWREGLSPDWQFSVDGGLASPKYAGSTRFLLGGALAWQWNRASADLPLDIAFTGGAGLSSGSSYTVVRIPVGAVVGHTFELDHGMELTPFAHPRLSLDACAVSALCNGTKVDVEVDVGVSYGITQQIAVRLAALLGGTTYAGSSNAIGFSLAWTPKGVKKF